MRSAVLFLVFNRPDTTRQVFDAIRTARPPRLYIAADGPREGHVEDADRCAEVRRIACSVDWPCDLRTQFRERNLGCKIGVSSAITWFFENEQEGIVLEDDVLPVPTFFRYCDELLERYRHDERISMISGCNLIANRLSPRESYFFSRYNHIWGWASWRRAWQHYDVHMKGWSEWLNRGGLARIANGSRLVETYWRLIMESAMANRIDTWDYQWTYACWRMGGLSVLPARNQTRNLGFGLDATHTTADAPSFVKESTPQTLEFPLIHPEHVSNDERANAIIDKHVYKISPLRVLERKILAYPFATTLLKALRKYAAGSRS